MESDETKPHEYDGIVEFDNPLPRWWLWTFALTVIFSIFYWMAYQSLPSAMGSFEDYGEAQVAHDLRMMASAVAPAEVIASSKSPEAVTRGEAIYQVRCASCHGVNAAGAVGPNLTDNAWIHGGDIKSIYISVAGGFPKLGMPEWRATLEDAQLREVVAYLLTQRDTNRAGRPLQGEVFEGPLR